MYYAVLNLWEDFIFHSVVSKLPNKFLWKKTFYQTLPKGQTMPICSSGTRLKMHSKNINKLEKYIFFSSRCCVLVFISPSHYSAKALWALLCPYWQHILWVPVGWRVGEPEGVQHGEPTRWPEIVIFHCLPTLSRMSPHSGGQMRSPWAQLRYLVKNITTLHSLCILSLIRINLDSTKEQTRLMLL